MKILGSRKNSFPFTRGRVLRVYIAASIAAGFLYPIPVKAQKKSCSKIVTLDHKGQRQQICVNFSHADAETIRRIRSYIELQKTRRRWSILDALRDSTLQPGDIVSTSEGFLVFEGWDMANANQPEFVLFRRADFPLDRLRLGLAARKSLEIRKKVPEINENQATGASLW